MQPSQTTWPINTTRAGSQPIQDSLTQARLHWHRPRSSSLIRPDPRPRQHSPPSLQDDDHATVDHLALIIILIIVAKAGPCWLRSLGLGHARGSVLAGVPVGAPLRQGPGRPRALLHHIPGVHLQKSTRCWLAAGWPAETACRMTMTRQVVLTNMQDLVAPALRCLLVMMAAGRKQHTVHRTLSCKEVG